MGRPSTPSWSKGSSKGSDKGKGKGRGSAPRIYWREKTGAGESVPQTKAKESRAPASKSKASTQPLEKRLVGFDWDCTLTVRHFYKVFAWGYASGNSKAHAHCEAFAEWCKKHSAPAEMTGRCRDEDSMSEALEDFCRFGGEETFREMFREVFLGGEERIALVASALKKMQDRGVDFAIVTAGVSTSVLRALTAVPEWLPFFNSARVWDTQQGRHSIRSIAGMKALILRDLCPEAKRIVLVDDSLCRDAPPEWVLHGAGVETMDLPYEGPGVTEDSLKSLEEAVLK